MVQIAILGFGTVGSGVAHVVDANAEAIARRVYAPVEVKYIMDLHDFPSCPWADRFVHDFSVIENDPERLAEIKGISLKKACEINNEYIKQFGMRNLAIFLQDNNISPNFAGKIFKKYGSTAVDKIRANVKRNAKSFFAIKISPFLFIFSRKYGKFTNYSPLSID